MSVDMLENVPIEFYDDVMLAGPKRDRQIENYCKIIENMGNIVQHHGLCLFRHLKWAGIPAPVAVQKYAVGQLLFQLLADGCFPTPIVPLIQYRFSNKPQPVEKIPQGNGPFRFPCRLFRPAA